MADQVIPTGSLAPSLPLTLLAAPKLSVAPERPKSAKSAEVAPQGSVNRREDAATQAASPAVATAAQELQEFLRQAQPDIAFQMDEGSGQPFFKVINTQSNQVIRQIPAEEVLAMARKLRELAKPKAATGILVDKEG